MTLSPLEMEDAKLDIINWINKIQDERLIYTIEMFRVEQLDFKNKLTEEQKIKIMRAISTLEG